MDPIQSGQKTTASQSAAISLLIKEGSVAERIAQLQAKLSPTRNHSSSPTVPGITRSPTASALSKYSVSQLLPSPKNIPLPKTPETRGCSFKRHVKNATAEKNDSPGRLGFPQHEGPKDCAQIRSGQETLKFPDVQNDKLDSHSPKEAYGSHDALNHKRTFMAVKLQTPMKDGSRGKESLSGTVSTIGKYNSPLSAGNEHETDQDSIQLPYCLKHNRILHTPGQEFEVSPDPSKRSSNTSPVGAYSKILPYMLDPSITSYIPRRQSRSFDVEDGSPMQLRKMDSTEIDGPSKALLTSSSPSPRRRDQRSMRRRTMNTKSEGMSHLDEETPTNIEQETQSIHFTVHLEDVFLQSAEVPKPYFVELPSITTNATSAIPESRHNIRNPNYTPSVMPRRLGSRQSMKDRHGRPVIFSTVSKQRYGILPDQKADNAQCQLTEGRDDLSRDSRNLYVEDESTTGGTESRVPMAHIMSRASSTSSTRTTSEQRPYILDEQNDNHPARLCPIPDISAGDGADSSHESDCSIIHDHRTVEITVEGVHSTKSRIPRPISRTHSETTSNHSTVPRVGELLSTNGSHESNKRGLRVIVTVNQCIKDVIKFEIHPPTKNCSLNADAGKENCSIEMLPTVARL